MTSSRRQISLKLCALAWAFSALASQGQTLNTVRTSSFEYDPSSGLLIREVVEPDRPNDCLSTTYGYDALGHKRSSTSAACPGASADTLSSAGTARSSTSAYLGVTVSTAPTGANPMPAGQIFYSFSSGNALGHSESRAYDARSGNLLRLTGPNGLTTRWEYDGFGRKTKEVRADSTYTVWNYQYCNTVVAGGVSCPSLAGGNSSAFVFTQSEYAANGSKMAADKISYVDALGRVLRVQTTDYSGNTVVQDSTYNALGQLISSTQPYVPGQTQYATTQTYDALGRVRTQSSPDPDAPNGVATVSYEYNGLSVTVTNAKSQRKTTTKNLQGQTAQVTDHDGKQVLYSYDALGQLIQTNAAGQITTLSYDQRGRKTGMNDPAMGVWSYAYNAYGELVRQSDSLGQSSTMAYDALGRMTARYESDLTSTWYYDRDASNVACGKSIGKLCEARAGNGYRRLHNYDSLGRGNSTSTAQDSSQTLSTVSQGYDANTGRMNSQSWPTGYTASYGYSTLGYLQSVSASGGGAPATQLDNLKYDSQGRLTSYRQGGRITTAKGYDAATGRLTQIQAQVDGQAVGSLFRQNYSYDALSNLTAKSDANTGVQESYGYDNLNRLTSYTSLGGSVSPPTTTQVVYDARGNIVYKSDVGRYWYDSQRPNRLANITLEGYAGAQALTGTRALSYVFDDYGSSAKSNGSVAMGNGNLMYTVSHDSSSGKHTVRWESYTSFNMPLEVKYGNIGSTQATTVNGFTTYAAFVYDCPDGQTPRGTPYGTRCTVTAPPSSYYQSYCYLATKTVGCLKPVCPANYFPLSENSCVAYLGYASLSYTCPSGYSLSGTDCRAQSNSATTATSDRTLNFTYGPEHQRVKQLVTLTGNAPSNMTGGTTWYLHGGDNQLIYEREVKVKGVLEHRHYLQAAGMTFALVVTRTGSGVYSGHSDPTQRPTQVSYYQQDHLGSIAAIADDNGTVIERLAYDPWGKRRYPNGIQDKADSIVGVNTDRGYTLHEHLDEVGVIHMNGRVYDPLIGRFMSADPFIQAPGNLQSYNRYAYVMNNPLALTDPSGYNWWSDRWREIRPVVAIAVAFYTGQFIANSIMTAAANGFVATGATSTALATGIGTEAAGLTLAGSAVAGAAGGFAAGLVASGGNLNAAAQGAFTGALFGAAGGVGGDDSAARYAAHAGAGCVSSVAGGGKCGQGAASAVFGKYTTNQIAGIGGDSPSAMIARGVATSVAGGVGSVIAGGKFENGAVTAAFGYLFNELLHSGPGAMWRSGYETRDAASNGRIWSLDPGGTDPSIKLDVVTAFNNAEANGDGPLRIAQGYRTNAEQDALYAQGRTAPGRIVTWARGGESIHNLGHAIDIFRIDGGNLYNVSPATVNYFKQQGFTWGGDWKAPKTDKPHFQR